MDGDDDADSVAMFGGRDVRESRRSCSFCANRAIVQCDGDRCIRQLCDGHCSWAGEHLAFCPPCDRKQRLAAAAPKQIELFSSTAWR
jgi:hypothetical protein